jgi:response regulator RpfG family c-di-GMP phosphodiesterase
MAASGRCAAPCGSTAGRAVPEDELVAAAVLLDVSKVLGGLLGLARPRLGARTEQVTRLVRQVARGLELPRTWEFEVAARLSQIGWLTVPTEMHEAAWRGDALPDDEWCAIASHPLVARDLLSEVRCLDGVREMIARQREPYAVDGDVPATLASRDRLMAGGQILKVCADFVTLQDRGLAPGDAIARLEAEAREYDPEIVAALARTVANAG